MRRIPPDKAAEIVRLRAMGVPVEEIAERLGLHRSTVYNYLGRLQAFADEAFLEELERELETFHRLHRDGNEQYIPVSEQARRLGGLLRKHGYMFEEFIAQAILNAHWRRIKACRRKRST